MDVFLVPVAQARYRLYVETPDDDADVARADATPPRGWIGRQIQRFKETLAEAEAERLRSERGEPSSGTGLWRTIMRKIAETIAEQRLLWHLRNQTVVQLHHPTDLDGPGALRETKSDFSREAAKHLRWLLIDGALVAITGPLFFFVPGPNVISWFFTFRAVGHYLSWRGAKKGLTVIDWRPQPSPPLTDVRFAIGLPAHDRRQRLDAIAGTLGLQHFTGFVERVAPRAS